MIKMTLEELIISNFINDIKIIELKKKQNHSISKR